MTIPLVRQADEPTWKLVKDLAAGDLVYVERSWEVVGWAEDEGDGMVYVHTVQGPSGAMAGDSEVLVHEREEIWPDEDSKEKERRMKDLVLDRRDTDLEHARSEAREAYDALVELVPEESREEAVVWIAAYEKAVVRIWSVE